MNPDKIGKYDVIGEIGRGSSAIVYLANDPFNGRKVAVKVAYTDPGRDAEEAGRFEKLFLNEASLAGKLHHPNIINVFDAMVEGDVRFIVMEYVPAGSLKQYCNMSSLLPMRQVAMMIFKCARALDYAFENGVIHRDIKPANILLTETGEIKISDFGTAKITHSTHTQLDGFLGSPAYMSPEMINEHPANVQGDIYSLGVVMYELLAGRLPYQADNSVQMINKILHEDPTPLEKIRPDVPALLTRIVKRAMSKNMAERYGSWFEMARDLIEGFPQLEELANEISASEKFSKLRAIRFFAEFKDHELKEVVRAAQWLRRARTEHLVKEGDLGQALYIIVSGEVKVTRGNQFMGALSMGDCFGEMALIHGKRTATITSVSAVEFIRIDAASLEQLSESCQLSFNKRFLFTLIERLSATNRKPMFMSEAERTAA
ncbi:MAG TPA: serine/threonine-protein kinase [Burkholderiales bacterium]|nr:serine/threonine-protein kinase [Burkholderiales bacterium]